MKILVVGCGSIGHRHAANTGNFAAVGVVDKDELLALQIVKATGAKHFKNLDDGLAWKPQGVVVATPPNTHLSIARAAIESGADVLIEKPISNSQEGVDEFLLRARSLGRKVHVVCNMRFHPGPASLKRLLPEIGKPLFARAYYGNYLPDMRPGVDYRKLYAAKKETGGGVILDAIHEIDYLCWLFGMAHRVSCDSAKLSDLEIDVEDYAAIQLQMNNGVRCEIHLDYLQRFKRRGCEIIGSKGTLIWQSEGKSPENCQIRLFRIDTGKWHLVKEINEVDTNRPYSDLMKCFIEVLKGRDCPLLDGKTAAEELSIALVAGRSATKKTSINLRESNGV